MKTLLIILAFVLCPFALDAQEIVQPMPDEANSQEQIEPKQIDTAFSQELVDKLLANMRKRYAQKDFKTLQQRKTALENQLRQMGLSSETRQRLELEWIVIEENLNRPRQLPSN